MSSKLCQAELKDHQVGLFAGGGLFSWVQAHLLHEAGANLHVYTADVGQQDESQLTNFKQDMAQLGIPLHTVDLRDVMASFALQVLRYQASYQGGYWNTTGALRAVLVSQLAPRMVEEGCTVLAHGSVNGGNDFRRFTRYIQKFAPSAIPYAPWEDEEFRSRFRDRKEMVEFLLGQSYKEGLEAKEKLSTDGSLMGVSHEGVQLENETVPWIYAPWALTNLPQNAPSQATNVRIEFREGQLHTINGFLNSPQVLLGLANDIAGKHGVGLTAVFEDRVVGTKGRGIYEAPGMTLLGHAFKELCSSTLPMEVQKMFQSLSAYVARRLYDGRYYEIDSETAKSALDGIASVVNGIVEIEIYKGNMFCLHVTGQREDIREQRFNNGGHAWNGLAAP